jgi:phage baseplate assembly protein gpV
VSDGFLNWVSEASAPSSPKLNGVFVATVVDGWDMMGLGRVKVSIPALPDVEPWARVAAPFAGDDAGFWALPQVDDEVLVAFERGDVTHPYVIGSLWSMDARPPAEIPTDAVTKRILKTPEGHVIELDDLMQTITITTTTDQEVVIGPTKIELVAGKGTAKVTIGTDGAIKLESAREISMSAPRISLDAKAQLSLSGTSVSVQATGNCSVQGAVVAIN